MLKAFDPKFLDIVTDAKQKKSLKKKRRLMTFWRRLSSDQLSSIQKQVRFKNAWSNEETANLVPLCPQFTNPDVTVGASQGPRGRSHHGQDSFDGGGSVLLSSAATMAIENSVTEEPSSTGEHWNKSVWRGMSHIREWLSVRPLRGWKDNCAQLCLCRSHRLPWSRQYCYPDRGTTAQGQLESTGVGGSCLQRLLVKQDCQRCCHGLQVVEHFSITANNMKTAVQNRITCCFCSCIATSKNSSFITWGDVLDFYIKHVMQPSQAKKASRISK